MEYLEFLRAMEEKKKAAVASMAAHNIPVNARERIAFEGAYTLAAVEAYHLLVGKSKA